MSEDYSSTDTTGRNLIPGKVIGTVGLIKLWNIIQVFNIYLYFLEGFKLSLYLSQIPATLILFAFLWHKTDLVHHFTNGASRIGNGVGFLYPGGSNAFVTALSLSTDVLNLIYIVLPTFSRFWG